MFLHVTGPRDVTGEGRIVRRDEEQGKGKRETERKIKLQSVRRK
jgi:hypothetical protein